MQVSGDGGSDCDSAAIVVARSLFLPEPRTHIQEGGITCGDHNGPFHDQGRFFDPL